MSGGLGSVKVYFGDIEMHMHFVEFYGNSMELARFFLFSGLTINTYGKIRSCHNIRDISIRGGRLGGFGTIHRNF
mgnify:CR=1 FL=1